MQHKFGSKKVEDLFRNAGWYEGRKVDPAQLARWFKEAREGYGCYPFRAAIEFLEEFGGLTLGRKEFSGRLILDPLRLGQFGEPELWHYWEWSVKEVLFPIGSAWDESEQIALGSSGALYSGGISDSYLGPNIFEGFANYFGHDPSNPIIVDLVYRKTDEEREAYEYLSGLAFPEDFQ